MNAEIIAIGDEITSGRLLDTNTQWLSLRLEELGVGVSYHTTVGDRLEPGAEVFRRAIERADVVVSSGGLGSTADDLTREALARAAGRQLQLERRALDHIRQLFARRKRPMSERNERQALFPAGSRMIPNPHGTAPGIDLEVPRIGKASCRVFALPGVPAEMKEMWHGSVAGALEAMGAGRRVILRRRINCFGAAESRIEAMLPDMIRRGRKPEVGINASRTTIILRIAAEGDSPAECRAAMEPTVAEIRRCLGSLIFGQEDDKLQDAVARLLLAHKRTLATAEWGTAGLLAEGLAAAETRGAFLGGVVAASRTALKAMLGVPDELIDNHGTAGELARAMAASCLERFRSDYALAVGKFPRFDPQAERPEPFFCALADRNGVRVESFPFAGHPALLKVYCAKRALNMLRLAMLDEFCTSD